MKKIKTNLLKFLEKTQEKVDEQKVDEAENVADENIEEEKEEKKGIIFSSSVEKLFSTESLSSKFNCSFSKEDSFYIQKKKDLKDPEKKLEDNVSKYMSEEVSMVIIQVGSNEITDLNLVDTSLVVTHEILVEKIKDLTKLAKNVA